MGIVNRLSAALRVRMTRWLNRVPFEEDCLRRMPSELRPAAAFAFYGKPTPEERELGTEIESFRARIPNLVRTGTLASFSSPHSHTFEVDPTGHAIPGPYEENTVANVSRTGSDARSGILLRRIVEGLGAQRIIELGTNTGFSGCYFVSAHTRPHLTTVEGSGSLCEIASANIGRFSSDVRIMNQMFDEAIDRLAAEGAVFDLAFLDGQHERQATWHFAERLRPLMASGGALVFDDIYWSDDMNQLWKDVVVSDSFSTTVDLRTKGIAILSSGDLPRRHFDVCEYSGRPLVFRRDW